MHVESVKFSSIESIHLKEIVIRVVFLRSMYAVVCLTMNISIENVKIKTLFDSDAELHVEKINELDTIIYSSRN